MKTILRPLLLCAALAGLIPPTLAAFADNPPAGDNPPAAVAAPADSAAKSTAVATESANAAPAPTPAPTRTASSTPPAPPVAETTTPAAATVEPKAEASGEGTMRTLDAPAAETDSEKTDAAKGRSRRGRSHGSENDRVTVGGDAELNKGEVANTVVAIAGNARSAGVVNDTVVAIAGNAHVTGPVSQTVVAVLGNVYVDAKVGEIVAVAGDIELGPNAEVEKDVVSVFGKVTRDPKAIIHGDAPTVSIGSLGLNAIWLQSYLKNCLFKARLLAFGPSLAWAWFIALGFLFFYVVLGLVFGNGLTACAQTLETRPGGSILAAFLTLLLTPVLIVLLCITVVGIAVVPFVAVAVMCATLFGKAVMLCWIGRRITRLFGNSPLAHPAFAVLFGGLIVLALYLVPFVSLVVYKVLGVLGLGVVVYSLVLASKRDKPVPTVPAYAASVPPPVGGGMASAFTDAGSGVAAGVAGVATAPAVAVPPTALIRAGFWVRTGALLIDVMLAGMVLAVIPRGLHLGPPGMMLLLAVYGAVLWKLRGTTIGGIICGLRVVRTDGRELDWPTAVVRALSCFLSLIPAGLGFIWVAIDDERQSWHDKIAGTTVVYSRGPASLV